MIPRIIHRLRLIARGILGRRGQERELDRELRDHLEHLVEDNIAAGMKPGEARLAALREFGGIDQYREACRDTWRPEWIGRILGELRCAFHSLRRSPGFTVIAIVTLAVGIGANTSMFSLVNTVMLAPPPYPDSGQLDQIHRSTAHDPAGQVSAADYRVLTSEMHGYGEVAAYAYADVSLAEPGHPADLFQAFRVSANFFPVLGIQPQMGRTFRSEEAIRGNHRLVVLSERCWKNRFGGDPAIIGRSVRVDGEPHEIVGVMPSTFNDWRHFGWVDVFVPLGLTEAESTDRTRLLLGLIGRRPTGRSHEEGAGFIASFGQRLATEHPAVNASSTWRTVPLHEILIGDTGGMVLGMLVGLSGFVVLIACSNLANLLLARTMVRAREFAVRSALGASRGQLLRPLLVESLLLALAGGALAVLVALWFADWIGARSMDDKGESVAVIMNWPVLAWALGAALVTALAFGMAPAVFALRLNLGETLKSGARGMTGGRGHQRFRHLLIVGQIALAMVLLAGAALFIRGIADLNDRRAGWESADLATGTVHLPATTYGNSTKLAELHRLMLERLGALPGVTSVSLSQFLPFFTWYEPSRYIIEGRDLPEPGREPAALVNRVSRGYFATVGTPLLAGRVFDDHDTAGSTRVAIVSESTARAFFGNESPIGRRIATAGEGEAAWCEVVGVVADVKSIFPDPTPVTHQVYHPLPQAIVSRAEIAVRSDGTAPAMLLTSIRSVIAELDPDLPVRNLKPADVQIARANYQLAVLRDMLALIATMGLGIAALGIYGVIARLMAQRTSEFGIRLALGAQVRDICRLVLDSGARLALLGSLLGLLGAVGLGQLIAAAFPNMDLDRGPALAAAAALLFVVAMFACYLPARRAARIDPTEALRAE